MYLYKNCPRRGVKKWQSSVHVVVECPLSGIIKNMLSQITSTTSCYWTKSLPLGRSMHSKQTNKTKAVRLFLLFEIIWFLNRFITGLFCCFLFVCNLIRKSMYGHSSISWIFDLTRFIYNAILFSSPLVLLSNLELCSFCFPWFFICPHIISINLDMPVLEIFGCLGGSSIAVVGSCSCNITHNSHNCV